MEALSRRRCTFAKNDILTRLYILCAGGYNISLHLDEMHQAKIERNLKAMVNGPGTAVRRGAQLEYMSSEFSPSVSMPASTFGLTINAATSSANSTAAFTAASSTAPSSTAPPSIAPPSTAPSSTATSFTAPSFAAPSSTVPSSATEPFPDFFQANESSKPRHAKKYGSRADERHDSGVESCTGKDHTQYIDPVRQNPDGSLNMHDLEWQRKHRFDPYSSWWGNYPLLPSISPPKEVADEEMILVPETPDAKLVQDPNFKHKMHKPYSLLGWPEAPPSNKVLMSFREIREFHASPENPINIAKAEIERRKNILQVIFPYEVDVPWRKAKTPHPVEKAGLGRFDVALSLSAKVLFQLWWDDVRKPGVFDTWNEARLGLHPLRKAYMKAVVREWNADPNHDPSIPPVFKEVNPPKLEGVSTTTVENGCTKIVGFAIPTEDQVKQMLSPQHYATLQFDRLWHQAHFPDLRENAAWESVLTENTTANDNLTGTQDTWCATAESTVAAWESVPTENTTANENLTGIQDTWCTTAESTVAEMAAVEDTAFTAAKDSLLSPSGKSAGQVIASPCARSKPMRKVTWDEKSFESAPTESMTGGNKAVSLSKSAERKPPLKTILKKRPTASNDHKVTLVDERHAESAIMTDSEDEEEMQAIMRRQKKTWKAAGKLMKSNSRAPTVVREANHSAVVFTSAITTINEDEGERLAVRCRSRKTPKAAAVDQADHPSLVSENAFKIKTAITPNAASTLKPAPKSKKSSYQPPTAVDAADHSSLVCENAFEAKHAAILKAASMPPDSPNRKMRIFGAAAGVDMAHLSSIVSANAFVAWAASVPTRAPARRLMNGTYSAPTLAGEVNHSTFMLKNGYGGKTAGLRMGAPAFTPRAEISGIASSFSPRV